LSAQVRRAREALGARLREIRKDADLTGRVLADLAGWHFTKVSKLENGAQAPSDSDIRAWCRACGSEEHIPDLLATVRAIESLYIEWRRKMRAGQKHAQLSAVPLYEDTSLFRIYETLVIPGLLHTAEYAAEIFRFWASFLDLADDIDAAIAARVERQRILYTGDRRFMILIEERALRTWVGGPDVMAGQLDRTLAVMSLSRVSLGIIPTMSRRHTFTQGSFWIFDDSLVQVEGVSAGLDVTQPTEIALYAKTFALLQRSAVSGQAARDLIQQALSDIPRIASQAT
jgi:transcriptional regulator with XRE-family HTH domain